MHLKRGKYSLLLLISLLVDLEARPVPCVQRNTFTFRSPLIAKENKAHIGLAEFIQIGLPRVQSGGERG